MRGLEKDDMGTETECLTQDDGRDTDDEEEYEEAGGGNRLLGFMFGNVDDSGELDVDYLDEDAKEHLGALADKLGPSFTEIDLSAQAGHSSASAADEDYDEKADDAIDYEDIDEQYEGPEVQTTTEEDYLLPKKEFFSADVSVTVSEHKTSVFDDENYDDDEDEDEEKEHEVAVSNSKVDAVALPDLPLYQLDQKKSEVVESESGFYVLPSSGMQGETHSTPLTEGIWFDNVDHLGSVGNEALTAFDVASQEDACTLEDQPLDAKCLSPLPILYIEDGMATLRFSEIFGVHEPTKRREKREHRYSTSKDKYASAAATHVEDDEEDFLKAPSQSFPSHKLSRADKDDASMHLDENMDFARCRVEQRIGTMALPCDDAKRDTCVSGEPLMGHLTGDLSVEWHMNMSYKFYPLDQQDWEDAIIWDDLVAVSDLMENGESSCLDYENIIDEDREIVSEPQNCRSGFKIGEDEKDSAAFISTRPVTVELFDARDPAGEVEFCNSAMTNHPQLLRLEYRTGRDYSDASNEVKENESEELRHDFLKWFSKLSLKNRELCEGSWLSKIIWEYEQPTSRPKLILDLLDEQMLFEVVDNKDYELLQLHARAMVVTQSHSCGTASPVDLSGYALSGGQFNIANDKFYANRKISPQLKSLSKKRNSHGVKVLHSIPALKLETIKPRLSNKDIANFHRPKSIWYPHNNEVVMKEQENMSTQGHIKVIVKSLGGKGIKLHVDSEETILSVKTKVSKKLDFRLSESVKIFYSGQELEDHKTVLEQNVRPNSLLHIIRTKVHLLPMAQKLSRENKSLRPPGAFKKSDLSVKDGHIFLMEYCEERPLLLGNAGMGARFCTYYQKIASDDQTGDMLRNQHSNLGTVLILDPADKSPFLGDIKPGSFQSSLETNMYRAPVFPHKVASTDYLLVRSTKGKLSIRRIDRINVVGQQEPHVEVMAPLAKGLQTYIMNRLLVYMYREFRAAEKRGELPCICADELYAQFPNISEPFLRKRLKHCAELQKGSRNQLLWAMKRNFHIPSEEQLRRLVSPENVCTYESMQAGLYRLKRLGITRLSHLTGPTQLAALSSAMNQLPDEAIALAAASHIERELQITPWNLSSNFVACTTQDRENIERLEITGVGDPSGRGLGFSYVRLAPKAPISNTMVKKKPIVARGSTVTGTDADLRRLSMEAAREVLLKFNVPEEQIAKLTRWHRIAMIRKLSSEQPVSGVEVDPTTMSKYARGQRMSFLQLQQQTREKCQEIWERQIKSLSALDDNENESDSEANSDLDSFAGDLENLLDAEECDEGEDGNLDYKNDMLDGVKGLKMRRNPSQALLEEEFEDEAAEAAELRRILMDDEEGEKKKKKKPSSAGNKIRPVTQSNLVLGNAERTKKTNAVDREAVGPMVLDGPSTSKQNAILCQTEVENFPAKKIIPGMVPVTKKDDILSSGEVKKKVKIMTDGFKPFKEKKSARENFVCGACGQLGHMRTNKNCPKFREEPETPLNCADQEKTPGKPSSLGPAQPQQRSQPKKLISKNITKVTIAEMPDPEPSISKAKVLKVKCSSLDKIPDKVPSMPSQSSEQPTTSETESGFRHMPKVSKIKITSKNKQEDTQVESHRPSIIIRPPSEVGRENHWQKVIIKRPKEVMDIDQLIYQGNADREYVKTKKIVELSDFERRQEVMSYADDMIRAKAKESKRFWEEEEKRRAADRRKEEEMRKLEEQSYALIKYEESIKREREEEELQRAKKMKKKKKKSSEAKDEYLEEFLSKKSNRWIPERERSAKRKTVMELGRYAAEYVPPIKRRRGGEVLLANILESIVEELRKNRKISYLFLVPVTKKEAPDYLDVVKRPMDLSTIREKVRKLEYKDRNAFRQDVCQIMYNAHLYNAGRNPGIPPLADKLLELCDYYLEVNDASLAEAEASCE